MITLATTWFRCLLALDGSPPVGPRLPATPAPPPGSAPAPPPALPAPSTGHEAPQADRADVEAGRSLASGHAAATIEFPQATPQQELTGKLEAIRRQEEEAMAATLSLTVAAWQAAGAEPRDLPAARAQLTALDQQEQELSQRLDELRQRQKASQQALGQPKRPGDPEQAAERVRAELFLRGAARQIQGLKEARQVVQQRGLQLGAGLQQMDSVIRQRQAAIEAARADAARLADTGDVQAWAAVLGQRDLLQRARIMEAYQQQTGQELADALVKHFAGADLGHMLYLLERPDRSQVIQELQRWQTGHQFSEREHVARLHSLQETLADGITFDEKNIRDYDREAPFFLSDLYRADPAAHDAIRRAGQAYDAYEAEPGPERKLHYLEALADLQDQQKKVHRIYDRALADRSRHLGEAAEVCRFVRDAAIAAEVSLVTGGLATGSLAVGGSAALGTGARLGLAFGVGAGGGTAVRLGAKLEDNVLATGQASLSLHDLEVSARASAVDAGLALVLGMGLPRAAETLQAAGRSKLLNLLGKGIQKLAVADAVDPSSIPLKVVTARMATGVVGANAKQLATNIYYSQPLTDDLWKATIQGALGGVSGTVRN